MNKSNDKIKLSKARNSVMIILILMLTMYPVTISAESKNIEFEGINWYKEIRGRGSSSTTDYFPSEQSKVTWSNANSELSALEGTATYLRYVGFAEAIQSQSGQIHIEGDWKVSSGHSSPRRMYVGIFDQGWGIASSFESTTSTSYVHFSYDFTVTPNEGYYIFFFYSDAWSYDWNTKIFLKNYAVPWADKGFNFIGQTTPGMKINEISSNQISSQYDGSGSNWVASYIDKPFDIDSSQVVDVEYSFSYPSNYYMGTERMMFYDATGANSLWLAHYDAWGGSTGRYYIYGYKDGVQLPASSYATVYSQNSINYGKMQVTFSNIDHVLGIVDAHVEIDKAGGGTYIKDIIGISIPTKVRLYLQYHDTYWSSSQSQSFFNYVESDTPSIDFSGYNWELNSYNLNSISNEINDFRETVNFNKPLLQSAQMSHTYTQVQNLPFEATVSFKGSTINAQDHEFAPSLMIDFGPSYYARLSLEANAISFENGLGGLYAYWVTPQLNTWYDLRIQVKNNELLTGYFLNYAYKLTTDATWTVVGEFSLSATTLGSPTVILGTHNPNGVSSSGGADLYRFSNFMIVSLLDQDFDGLTDVQEKAFRDDGILISSSDQDSDNDGISDFDELNTNLEDREYIILTASSSTATKSTRELGFYKAGTYYYSNPGSADSDGDGLNDLEEKLLGTSPMAWDTDGDGVWDIDDSAPLVKDTFAPMFIDIRGKSFTFSNPSTTVLVPNDPEPIYFYYKQHGDYILVMAELFDDSKVDKVHVRSTGCGILPNCDDIDSTWDFSDAQTKEYKQAIGAPASYSILTHTVYFKFEDTLGYQTDELNFEVKGGVAKAISTVVNWIVDGIDWMVTGIQGFFDWVKEKGQAALEAVSDWLESKLKSALRWIQSQLDAFASSVLTAINGMVIPLMTALANYNGNLATLRDTIIDNSPIGAVFEPVENFMNQYSTEIEWATKVLDILFIANPAGLASLGLSIAGDAISQVGSGDIVGILSLGSQINSAGSFIGSTMVNIMGQLGLNTDIDYSGSLPTSSVMDSIFQDLSIIMDSTSASFFTGLKTGLESEATANYGLTLNQSPLLTNGIVILQLIVAVTATLHSWLTASSLYEKYLGYASALFATLGIGINLASLVANPPDTSSKVAFFLGGFTTGLLSVVLAFFSIANVGPQPSTGTEPTFDPQSFKDWGLIGGLIDMALAVIILARTV